MEEDPEFVREYERQKPSYDALLDMIKSGNWESANDHYKEVWNDAWKATDEDFLGGCPTCQFGEVDKLKEFTKCPYCQNELEVTE